VGTRERAKLTPRLRPTHSRCAARGRHTSRRWLHVRTKPRHGVHSRPSRSVAIGVLATRTALLPGVHVCMDLRERSLGVGLAYRLATWSRNDQLERTRTRPVTCGNASRLGDSNSRPAHYECSRSRFGRCRVMPLHAKFSLQHKGIRAGRCRVASGRFRAFVPALCPPCARP
jgi:hypothetical protein